MEDEKKRVPQFLGAKSTSIRDCVGRLVGPLVGPHDAITWKTSYIAIDSRKGGGRGKLVTSRFLRT
jgi:allophanate hydrolase subunit 2